MRVKARVRFFSLFFLLFSLPIQNSITIEPAPRFQPIQNYKTIKALNNLYPYFVENKGQLDENVKYQVKMSNGNIYFTPREIVYQFLHKKNEGYSEKLKFYQKRKERNNETEVEAIRVKFIGSNENVKIIGLDDREAKFSYFRGNNPRKWVKGAQSYYKILYKELYPHIDLIIYGSEGRIKYEYRIRAGGEVDKIAMKYEGVDRPRVNKKGQLEVETEGGLLIEDVPLSYQLINNKKAEVKIDYLIDCNRDVRFKVAGYRKDIELIIDPLIYSTYLGGSNDDYGYAIAVDGQGNAYIVGKTSSIDFPVISGSYDALFNGGSWDIFITKINSTGTDLLYSTYLGGNDDDRGYGIAVDGSGNVYITGCTYSSNFPVSYGSYDTVYGGNGDVFITRINPAGTELIYSTYLGGIEREMGYGIAVDGNGGAYITGSATGFTGSQSFPITAGAFDSNFGGQLEAFITKINSKGTNLLYSTYLGGSDQDRACAIAVDGSGNAYVTGETVSSDFPTTPGSPEYHEYYWDAFVARINSTGTGAFYSILLGGFGNDCGYGIDIDQDGNAFVAGATTSIDFPITIDAYDTGNNGGSDVFITKINYVGTELLYSTYLGGDDYDCAYAIAVDGSGNAYVTGETSSLNFPTTIDAYDTNACPTFITKINSTGTGLIYSTFFRVYLSHWDARWSDWSNKPIAIDENGDVYITGCPAGQFPTTPGAFDLDRNGGYDTFITKIHLSAEPPPETPSNPDPSDGAMYIPIDSDFHLFWSYSWRATSYDVYLGVSSPPPQVGTVTSEKYSTGILNYDTIYYWKIAAKNNSGITLGPIWTFKTIPATHTVSTPNTPSGPSIGGINFSYTFTTGGSSCSHGHPVEYSFSWGDGTYSSWSTSMSAGYSWTNTGTYTIKALARCSNSKEIVSDWSYGKTIEIFSNITVTTSPSGRQIIVDGSTYTAPQIFNWVPGSTHSIGVTSPQSGGTGVQYVYASWSDGGEQTHNVSPTTGTTYTANFTTQYYLTTVPNPSGGGKVTPGSGWYNSGQQVSVQAVPSSGYKFIGWSGSASGTTNPIAITMNAAKSITANFTAEEKKKGCFIATAAYGSPLHPHVKILRDLRDKYLMPIKPGRVLVSLYYKCSPFVADLIAKNKTLKIAVRLSLLPLVAFSYSMIHFGLIITTVMLVFIFGFPIFIISFWRKKNEAIRTCCSNPKGN